MCFHVYCKYHDCATRQRSHHPSIPTPHFWSSSTPDWREGIYDPVSLTCPLLPKLPPLLFGIACPQPFIIQSLGWGWKGRKGGRTLTCIFAPEDSLILVVRNYQMAPRVTPIWHPIAWIGSGGGGKWLETSCIYPISVSGQRNVHL